jgi:hypothetical protein
MPDDHHDPVHRSHTIRPTFTGSEQLALAGFLAGFRGLTAEACTLDLRQWVQLS